VTTFALSPPPTKLTLRLVFAAWRGITPAQLRTTFLLGLAFLLFGLVTGGSRGVGLRSVPFTFVGAQIRVFALLLAFVVADRLTGKDPSRRGAYALAAVVGAAVGTALALAFVATMIMALFGGVRPPGIGFYLYAFLENAVVGCAVFWVIIDRRRERQARERMHRAELDRIDAERRSIESDLQAMQARVEPQFLFNTLAHVKQLYESDPTRGERMLDELIAYLRAAMPKMRDTSSTVSQEIELARAYFGIVRQRLGEGLSFEVDMTREVGDARMPPMMLLPLIDHAIAHSRAGARSSGSIHILASIADRKLRLDITDTGAGFLPENDGEDITGIRERLATLFGGDASLSLQRRGEGATEALLEFPFEPAPRRPDEAVGVGAVPVQAIAPHRG